MSCIRSSAVLVALAVVFVFTAGARAAVIQYIAYLDGPSESPPNASPGTGMAHLTYDDAAMTLRVEASFADLIGTTTAAHVHGPTAVAGAGAAGVITTTPTFPGFPIGVTSGTYDHTLDLTMASAFNPAFVTANGGTVPGARAALLASLDAGTAYFNIHTSFAPGGEIRGFFSTVPEPAAATILLATLLPLSLKRQRR